MLSLLTTSLSFQAAVPPSAECSSVKFRRLVGFDIKVRSAFLISASPENPPFKCFRPGRLLYPRRFPVPPLPPPAEVVHGKRVPFSLIQDRYLSEKERLSFIKHTGHERDRRSIPKGRLSASCFLHILAGHIENHISPHESSPPAIRMCSSRVILPSSMASIRSAWRAMLSSWVMTMRVCFCLRLDSFNSRMISSLFFRSRFPVGSSAKTMAGWLKDCPADRTRLAGLRKAGLEGCHAGP